MDTKKIPLCYLGAQVCIKKTLGLAFFVYLVPMKNDFRFPRFFLIGCMERMQNSVKKCKILILLAKYRVFHKIWLKVSYLIKLKNIHKAIRPSDLPIFVK